MCNCNKRNLGEVITAANRVSFLFSTIYYIYGDNDGYTYSSNERLYEKPVYTTLYSIALSIKIADSEAAKENEKYLVYRAKDEKGVFMYPIIRKSEYKGLTKDIIYTTI